MRIDASISQLSVLEVCGIRTTWVFAFLGVWWFRFTAWAGNFWWRWVVCWERWSPGWCAVATLFCIGQGPSTHSQNQNPKSVAPSLWALDATGILSIFPASCVCPNYGIGRFWYIKHMSQLHVFALTMMIKETFALRGNIFDEAIAFSSTMSIREPWGSPDVILELSAIPITNDLLNERFCNIHEMKNLLSKGP
ncbi:hypothetical protein RHMOL_Rhmol07G0178300 [Rhododendron molle]|uniref:Uncharacterized protein n=1 Tax=Rhododendron molle TaxID=49168 RepID=A0ACC0N1M8_RHOML|nr:hypothetical protein RHMOL_Rhmol07G0178300 [Rhododendron molle]